MPLALIWRQYFVIDMELNLDRDIFHIVQSLLLRRLKENFKSYKYAVVFHALN